MASPQADIFPRVLDVLKMAFIPGLVIYYDKWALMIEDHRMTGGCFFPPTFTYIHCPEANCRQVLLLMAPILRPD